ncbi:DUF420 domain-containing protein [Oceanicoccus sp. KOV_DT_Chl]|uniref:DUF420 domain-containing protein n=1 Tax=Oceanicoccus sp. KOV_DT_Chl TaxID=1904639 RepID=UPI000C79B4D2|nr:DUF420 domain-containing protein [Oceanicoccus sp. KOV_DT_Chl]
MLPQGFLGTRGDILMDLVILAFFIILPALLFSWHKVRNQDYVTHKKVQLSLASILAVAVVLFEADLKLSGGIFELTKASSYNGTTLLNSLIYGHTLVAILTTLIWIVLIILSLKKFDKPPAPNHFSKTHKRWGTLGMLSMIATGTSAFPLYYYGFYL